MIDKVVCLGLDKRKEMWPKLQEQVQKHFGMPLEIFVCGDGTDPTLTYDHVDTDEIGLDFIYTRNKAHYNAYLCHKKIFDRAYKQGLRSILFLEDDAYIVEDRIHLLFEDKCQSIIKNTMWDVIYLGWWQKRTGYQSEDREDLEAIWKQYQLHGIDPVPHVPFLQHETCGLHGIMISSPLLRWLANASYGPIDCLLHHNFKEINAYFMWPKVVHTYSTWSYCENSMCNRNPI